MRKQIPNIITALNLVCGCLALMQIAKGDLLLASLLVLAGAFFDFFDGMSARLLKVSSPIGAELDSLADVVTFGVVPSFIAFELIKSQSELVWLPFLALLIAVFSAFRLAKFNVDDRQTDRFIGLPTPANALFWVSLPFMQWQIESSHSIIDITPLFNFLLSPISLVIFTFFFSIALVAEIPLLSLKFKNLSWQANKSRFILLLISLSSILVFYFAAIPIILLLYFLISMIENRLSGHEIQS
ncbi:MAG: CDP-diacylglycerol--serine O-phosphatidyltransferase [Vicingaceae bacterium]